MFLMTVYLYLFLFLDYIILYKKDHTTTDVIWSYIFSFLINLHNIDFVMGILDHM